MTPAPVSALHPWNRPQAERLMAAPQRLPHALLLAGPAGLGKNTFGLHLAQWLLCAQPLPGGACGDCHGCRLYQAGSHPDLARVGPPEDGKAILVDQIRALGEFLHLTPHIAIHKVVLLAPAEAMNLNAANALLKLLEEPPAGSYLILIATQLSRLPATLRSRCTRVEFRPPVRDQGLAWLQTQWPNPGEAELLLELAQGAPLRALELAKTDYLQQRLQLMDDILGLSMGKTDPLVCAARWKTLGAGSCLTWLEGWIGSLIKLSMAPGGETGVDVAAKERLQALQKQLNLRHLFQFLERVVESKNLLSGPLDELLLLEDLLIRWTRLTRR